MKYFNKTVPKGTFDFTDIKLSISSYNESGDIRIFNNDALASYASSGNGSQSNPYILENYNVTTNANEPLYISSTSAYAIIRNNIFDNIDGSSNYGVFLYNTNHITLQNNTIRRAETGIYSSLGNDTTLLGNKFELIDGGEAQGVINFVRNQNSLIKDHTVNVTGQKGIYLQYTNTTQVENNSIVGVTRGIELTYFSSYPTYGYKNVVINNTISEVTMSAIFDSGKYNTFQQNIIKDLNDFRTGIELFGAVYTVIRNNTVIDAQNAFSLSMNTNYATIAFNTVISSSSGIYAYGSNVQHGRYYNNTFNNNFYGVSFSPSTSSMNNSFSYNKLFGNFNGFSIGDNLGLNLTLNCITYSSSDGIRLTSSTSGIWILNNSIMHSGSYGLTAVGSSTSDSRIMYNDFYNNSGTPGQVYDSSGYNIEENFYADHSNIDSNADGYADNEYNLDGGSYTDSKPLVNSNVIYTPLDVQKPVITTDNTSTTIVEYGLDGLTLSWIGTDENAESYMITRNSTNLFGSNQNWNSNESVAISLDGLAIGFHIFTITFHDSWNNSEKNTINVIVQDSTLPFLSETINSQSVEYGVKTITWTAVDLNPGNYSYWISNLSVIDQHWASGVQNSISIETLPLGSHELTLTVKDTEGQSIYIYSTIIIEDTTLPQIITSPVSNISFLESTSSVQVSYNVSDELPDEYSVEINGTVELTASWNDSILSINLAGFGLGKGVYNFTVTFFDNSSNSASSSITITVLDPNSPIIQDPEVLTFEELSTFTLEWIVNDTNPDYYCVYMNGGLQSTGNWNSNVTLSFNLNLGTYNITLWVNDTSGLSDRAVLNITIVDTTIPVIESMSEGVTLIQDEAYPINITVRDNHPGTYEILVNGSIAVSGEWTSSISVIPYLFTGGTVGIYNVTIVVTDQFGNHNSSSILIAVIAKSTTSTPETSESETTSTSTTSSSSPSTPANTSSTTTTLPSSSITGDSPLIMLSLFLLTGMILRRRRKYD